MTGQTWESLFLICKWEGQIGINGSHLRGKRKGEKSELWISMFLLWTSEKVGSQCWESFFYFHLTKWEVTIGDQYFSFDQVRSEESDLESRFLICKWEMTGQNWESLFLICKWEVWIANQCFTFERWGMGSQNCESPCFSFELVRKWAVNIGDQCFSFA